MNKITVIFWRDIPAQVIAKSSKTRKKEKIELSRRFMIAIDESSMKSGNTKSEEYLSEWKNIDYGKCGDDLNLNVKKLAEKLEKKYTNEKLKELISNFGFKKNERKI